MRATGRVLRFAAIVFAAIAAACGGGTMRLATPVVAQETIAPEDGDDECLSSGDMQEAVSSHRVAPPATAIRVARRAVPNADVLRASLCRDGGALVYRLTILRRDGRVVRVTVDAPTGVVKAVH